MRGFLRAAAPALGLVLSMAACSSGGSSALSGASGGSVETVETVVSEPAVSGPRKKLSDEDVKRITKELADLDVAMVSALSGEEKVEARACPADEARGAESPPAELSAFARAEKAFALDIYGRLRKKTGNLAFSPLSVSAALTMTWAGAGGATAAEMKKVLHLEGTPEETLAGAGQALRRVKGGTCTAVHVANRLFGEKAYSFEKPYLDKVDAAFGAPLERLDFSGAPGPSREHINGWVAAETGDRIKNLLPEGTIKSDTRLVLVSAIDFVADWEQPFANAKTRPSAFFTAKETKKDVPTMFASGHLRRDRDAKANQESAFKLAAADGVKLLEMAYLGSDLAMTLLLPDAVDGLADLEKKLSPEMLDSLFAKLSYEVVAVGLPKLLIETREPMALSEDLAKLGMSSAFDATRADFRGIANPPKAADRLFLARVLHKAYVKVDEKGTEASAATAVQAGRVGASMERPARTFIANHPFLFFLRDTSTGMILFMGRVSDPAGA